MLRTLSAILVFPFWNLLVNLSSFYL